MKKRARQGQASRGLDDDGSSDSSGTHVHLQIRRYRIVWIHLRLFPVVNGMCMAPFGHC
jgi:hypothetical protein